MNPTFMFNILAAQLRSGFEMEISVAGISMEPTLNAGDVVTVRQADTYEVGDILVFLYKGNLLIHRLLKYKDGRYFCKGDNAFRLEDMTLEDIAGKVIFHDGHPLSPAPAWFPALSYLVNRAFRLCGYNIEKTKQTGIYRFYYQTIWKVEDKTMTYEKNQAMDYILSDESSLAVFDPESGNTHFFNETGIDILNCLEPPCDLDTLLARLCEIYDSAPNDIKDDVQQFLAETVAKKVVLAK